jgi:hypothetical protein
MPAEELCDSIPKPAIGLILQMVEDRSLAHFLVSDCPNNKQSGILIKVNLTKVSQSSEIIYLIQLSKSAMKRGFQRPSLELFFFSFF